MTINIKKIIAIWFVPALLLPEFLNAQYMGGIGGGVASASLSNVSLSVTEVDVYAPSKYELYQNYPNPFNPSTIISFEISESSYTSLKIYNMMGQQVVTLISDYLTAGYYSREWNASGMASGIYFYKLQSGNRSQTKKLLLMK